MAVDQEAAEILFLLLIFLAFSSISLIRFFTSEIVLLNDASLFRLKSMFRMLFRFESLFGSISPFPRIRLKSSCDDDIDADDSRDLLWKESSLCFLCFRCST